MNETNVNVIIRNIKIRRRGAIYTNTNLVVFGDAIVNLAPTASSIKKMSDGKSMCACFILKLPAIVPAYINNLYHMIRVRLMILSYISNGNISNQIDVID